MIDAFTFLIHSKFQHRLLQQLAVIIRLTDGCKQGGRTHQHTHSDSNPIRNGKKNFKN